MIRTWKTFSLRCCALGVIAPMLVCQAQAAIVINEMLINHSSSLTAADQDREFLEFRSTTGGVEAMTGLTFLYIEGDGSNSGIIDFALDLSAFSTGVNGLMVVTDGLTAWDPAAEPETPINVVEFTNDDGGGDDLENGSATFAIVSGFTGAGGDDLDTDNDGDLDSMPWSAVEFAVGWREASGSTENSYADELGGILFDEAGAGTFDPDAYVMAPDGAFVFDSFSTDDDSLDDGPWVVGNTGGRAMDVTSSLVVPSPTFRLTPGSANNIDFLIPEPSTLALLLLVGGAASAVRMRVQLG